MHLAFELHCQLSTRKTLLGFASFSKGFFLLRDTLSEVEFEVLQSLCSAEGFFRPR